MTARKTVGVEDLGTTGERPGGTAPGSVSDLDIPADAMRRMEDAERLQKARMAAEPKVERFIPRIRPGNGITIIINGVRLTAPFNRKIMLPESAAALVDVAVARHMAMEKSNA